MTVTKTEKETESKYWPCRGESEHEFDSIQALKLANETNYEDRYFIKRLLDRGITHSGSCVLCKGHIFLHDGTAKKIMGDIKLAKGLN